MGNIFFLFLLFKLSFSEIIKIPFGIINTEKDIDSSPLISKLVYNKLYINFTIGTPPKKIKLFLRKDSFSLFINEANFNQTSSNSLELLSGLKTFFLDIYTTGYFSKDIMNFGNYKNDNLKLDFVLSVSDDNYLGGFGLKIPFNSADSVPSFLFTLKNNSIISSLTWTLKYNYSNKPLIESINDKNNPIGELIIGGDPHEYEENKSIYSENQYNFLEAPIHDRKYYWNLKFKSIYTLSEGDKIGIINNNYWTDEISLKAEYSVIWGPEVYKEIIHKIFFDKYGYKNTICFEKPIPQRSNLHYIECDRNDNFDLKKYPTIFFESLEFNKTFELTYEDLFVLDEKSNKFIYLIVFPVNYYESTWSLGIPFIRKYQFTFNEDKKVIGFYNSNDNTKDKEKKKSKIWLYFLVTFLFIVFCILLVLLGMLIHKMVYGEKRRKKANELDDDYDYETKKNIESINSENNINENENKKDNLLNE